MWVQIYIITFSFSIHLTLNIEVFFYLLAIVNSAATSIGIQIFLWESVFSSFGYIPNVDLLDYMLILFLVIVFFFYYLRDRECSPTGLSWLVLLAKAGSQEPNPSFPCVPREPHHLSNGHSPLRSPPAWSWNQELGLESPEPEHRTCFSQLVS